MSAEDAREVLHEAVQETAADDENIDGSVLLGWVTIAEWSAPDGTRWLSFVGGDAHGEPPPVWQVRGYLHNALNDWDDAE